MSKIRYEDRFAQIRQIAPRHRAICYWRNNLTLKDFRKEGNQYVLEDEGSYNGLYVWMRITVKEGSVKRVFERIHKGVIEFWGKPEHMGIMIRIRISKFPRIHKGSEGWLTYEFGMEGTTNGLSYIDNEAMNRRKEENGLEKIRKNKKLSSKEGYYDEEIYKKKAC